MALAYLSSKIRTTDNWFKVPDNPVSNPYAFIVNHGLREGSADEAKKVTTALKDIGLRGTVLNIRWRNLLPEGANPNDLPNVETAARYMRYRCLGSRLRTLKVMSLFTAHHEDDQYETVLMRLLSGHGQRGLQGMRLATDIPECYDVHGVYQSGFIDDQQGENPFWLIRPNGRERQELKRGLREEVNPAILAMEMEAALKVDINTYLGEYTGIAKGSKPLPLAQMEFEEGGVMVYRPLLGFSKDRLIATCVENNIPWFEDHTNADQTLTMRNAVRHMHKNYQLPVALQKPSILRLAAQCRARVASAEAEASRLLSQVRIHEFGPNTGTVVVTLPRFTFPTTPRRRSPARQQKRIEHYRHIAALLLRRLISMTTPERELSQPTQLAHLVAMLFPSLAESNTLPPEPKPYVICSVHFMPLPNTSPPRWLLSRAPYVSNVPRPSVQFHRTPIARRLAKAPSEWKTQGWSHMQLYDGRYWIRLLHRLPCQLKVLPFEPEQHKMFREALGDDKHGDKERKELAAMLRRYAPGKVRYTLPGIYAVWDVTQLLKTGQWWPEELRIRSLHERFRSQVANDDDPNKEEGEPDDGDETESAVIERIRSSGLSQLQAARVNWEKELPEDGTPQLLALPTLGFAVQGLEDWGLVEIEEGS
ncbi:hypothetical protein N0V88_000188 [Collariella sp. IMI 366227]|nr:hypothetical protein N0V88_000188 [Collariella sp. IMI 366227]